MTLWQGVVLGLVQGLTEFLPISSSGHLVLVEALTGVHFTDVTVEVSLHVATLGSVLVMFGGRLWAIARGVLRRDPGSLRYALLLVVATIPAGLIGTLLHHQIEQQFHSLIWLAAQFLVTGLILWWTRGPRGDRALPSLSAATGGAVPWAVSCVVAFASGVWSIRFLMALLRQGRLYAFAPYCWAVGLFTLVYALWLV